MNEIDIKQLVDVGQRTALLLGEITGRLIMFLNTAATHQDEIPAHDVVDLLEMIKERISSIYYEGK